MWGIVGDIVKGLVSGIIEGVSASSEKEAEISSRIVALLRAGADAVEAARASFASEDAQTRAAFAAARERLAVHLTAPAPVLVPVPTPLPPADDETTKP